MHYICSKKSKKSRFELLSATKNIVSLTSLPACRLESKFDILVHFFQFVYDQNHTSGLLAPCIKAKGIFYLIFRIYSSLYYQGMATYNPVSVVDVSSGENSVQPLELDRDNPEVCRDSRIFSLRDPWQLVAIVGLCMFFGLLGGMLLIYDLTGMANVYKYFFQHVQLYVN